MRKTILTVIVCAVVGWILGVSVGKLVNPAPAWRNEVPAPPDVYSQPVVEEVVNDYESAVVNDSAESVDTTTSIASDPVYTEEQLEILAIIVYQEAGSDACSDDTRRKVGSVFLNRVASPYFPDTFEEVATQDKQYGTLYKTGLKWPDRAVYDVEAHAVARAYAIAEELLLSGSILPPEVIWQAEFPQGDGTYCHQDGIYFCYSEVCK